MPFVVFPFSNFHELNADWILKKMREMVSIINQKKTEVDTAVETVSGYELRLENVEAQAHDLDTSRVSYAHTQELTDEQKQTARGNIGAAPARGVVMYNEAQVLSDAYKAQARGNIGAASVADAADTVKYTAQALTDAQKTQARANIGAAGPGDIPSGVVLYNEQQSLTQAQQIQARANIGAAGMGVVPAGAVRYDTTQSLTPEQKTNAQTNIDAASATETSLELAVCVKTVEQSFSNAEKAQARDNIGAISAADVPAGTVIGIIKYDAQSGFYLDSGAADIDDIVSALEQADPDCELYADNPAAWPGAPSDVLLSTMEVAKLTNCKVFRASNSDDFTITAACAVSEASLLRKVLVVTIQVISNTVIIAATFHDENLVPAATQADAGKTLTVSNSGVPGWTSPVRHITVTPTSTTQGTYTDSWASVIADIEAGKVFRIDFGTAKLCLIFNYVVGDNMVTSNIIKQGSAAMVIQLVDNGVAKLTSAF